MSVARVAQAANVSYATAWRVINNQTCTSEEVVAAVQRAMRQLGYQPQSSASPLSRRRGRPPRSTDGIRTRNIALLHFREATSISTFVLAQVQQKLAQLDLNLIFAQVTGPDQLPQAVRAGNVDGILGYGQFPDTALSSRIEKIPAVWMMSRADAKPDPWGDRIKPDHQAIGELAAQALARHGHAHVAYFNPQSDFAVYQQRLASFRTGCEQTKLQLETFTCTGTTNWDLQAESLVDQWLAANPRPPGIFIPVDRITVRVHNQLLRRGIQPGSDVDLVSCDNERELLAPLHPAPLSIDLNRETIARLAIDRLLWRMKNGLSSPRVVITVTPTVSNPAAAAPIGNT